MGEKRKTYYSLKPKAKKVFIPKCILDKKRKQNQEYDKSRENSTKRGYGARWQKAREYYLKKHPLCALHERVGFFVDATELDHIIPAKKAPELFWDRNNWQGLCKSCHSRKTAKGE